MDLDRRKVEAIDGGCSYIADVPTEDVGVLRGAGRLEATTDFSLLATVDTINICVPTPLRKTEELVQPLLEARGLIAGRDFFLAFSPERVDPGNARYNTRNAIKERADHIFRLGAPVQPAQMIQPVAALAS